MAGFWPIFSVFFYKHDNFSKMRPHDPKIFQVGNSNGAPQGKKTMEPSPSKEDQGKNGERGFRQ